MGIPPFEFFKMTSKLAVKKMFLRDIRQLWYQEGIPGIGNNIDEVAAFIKGELSKQNIKKVSYMYR